MSDLTNSTLRKYFDGYLDDAPISFVISTADEQSSRYVRANSAYLQLCGRSWPDIAGSGLVEQGAAIPSPERLRRLWFLNNLGRYKNEIATIGHSSGKTITVILSAQREVIGSCALDFEFLVEHRDISPKMQDHDSGRPLPPAAATPSRQAQYKRSIVQSLELMGREYARSVIIGMIVSVSRGVMYLSQVLPENSPVVVYVADYVNRHFGQVPVPIAIERAAAVFAGLSRETAEEHLLALATQIWLLSQFQTAEIREQLLSLVQPYTSPPAAVSKA